MVELYRSLINISPTSTCLLSEVALPSLMMCRLICKLENVMHLTKRNPGIDPDGQWCFGLSFCHRSPGHGQVTSEHTTSLCSATWISLEFKNSLLHLTLTGDGDNLLQEGPPGISPADSTIQVPVYKTSQYVKS